MNEIINLFGETIEVKKPEKKAVKDDIKVKKADVAVLVKHSTVNIDDLDLDNDKTDIKKLLNSNKLTLEDKVELIKRKVLLVLGKQQKNVIVIRDKVTLQKYISEAIAAGRIAIDTETNNSLDPVTCKLMGPCFYYPGGKQAYVPLNHVDLNDNLLANQLTEADIAEELNRINESGIPQIYANGKFDYEVLKCTTGVEIHIDWDTVLAARMLNENEEAGLKKQYISKIDPAQAKYSIEELFTGVQYKYIPPEIFALYAATDAMMTDKLYLYQLPLFEAAAKENTVATNAGRGLFWTYKNIELPIAKITGDMELAGVEVDTDFGARLKVKYEAQLKDKDAEIDEELKKLQPIIDAWLVSPAANQRARQYQPKKSKKSLDKVLAEFTLTDDRKEITDYDKNGKEIKIKNPNFNKRYKLGKSLAEQITNPINLGSPVQLGILFYEILKCPTDKGEKHTGEEDLLRIKQDRPDLKICDLLLDRREIVKLITTYIDVIPTLATHWPDHRIRFHLNSLGTDTGRYSSGGKIKYIENNIPVEVSGINIQNIPSRNPEIRMLFRAQCINNVVEADDNEPFTVDEACEIETEAGWKYCSDLIQGDKIIVDGVATEYRGRKYLPDTKEWLILAY